MNYKWIKKTKIKQRPIISYLQVRVLRFLIEEKHLCQNRSVEGAFAPCLDLGPAWCACSLDTTCHLWPQRGKQQPAAFVYKTWFQLGTAVASKEMSYSWALTLLNPPSFVEGAVSFLVHFLTTLILSVRAVHIIRSFLINRLTFNSVKANTIVCGLNWINHTVTVGPPVTVQKLILSVLHLPQLLCKLILMLI